MYILDIIGMIIAKVLGIIRMIIGYNLVPKAHSVKNQCGKGRRSRGLSPPFSSKTKEYKIVRFRRMDIRLRYVTTGKLKIISFLFYIGAAI